MAPQAGAPRLVLLFSGKRKSGKDFVAEALRSRCLRGGARTLGLGWGRPRPDNCRGGRSVVGGGGVLRARSRRTPRFL